jgi:hypothetical protein
MDKIEFLGEIKPLYLSGSSPNFNQGGTRPWTVARIFDPKLLLLESIPFDMVDFRTLTSNLKIEYLHMDYTLPHITQIPQSKLELLSDRRDSTVGKQVKTANFKREYNPLTAYAVEIRLSREGISSEIYGGDDNPVRNQGRPSWQQMLTLCNYDNSLIRRVFPLNMNYWDVQIPFDTRIGEFGNAYYFGSMGTLGNYPINEYLYNGGVPGFLDLMPYLIKNGNLIFNGLDQTIYISTDICKLNNAADIILVNGGYSGTAYFKERVRKIIKDITPVINATNTVTQVLPETPKRALIYLTNNTTKKLYFSFSNAVTLQSPYINPGGNLVWEHGEIVNLDGDTGLLQKYDKRSIFGLPLFVRSELGAAGTVTCEQYVYDY